MASFRLYGWLVVEIFSDSGHVGIGNELDVSPGLSQTGYGNQNFDRLPGMGPDQRLA